MKCSKKILTLMISVLMIVSCWPLTGAAQTINNGLISGEELEVVPSVDDLVSGEYYYIRNAGSNGYLTVNDYNAYQSTFKAEDSQKFQYIKKENGVELQSLYGNIGCNMDLGYLNVVPGGETRWAIQNDYSVQDGSVIFVSLGAMHYFPSLFNYMTARGNNDNGDVYLSNDGYGQYQRWYFEKVENHSNNVVSDDLLKDGGQYRIRNKASGKYLTVGYSNVYQYDLETDNSNQIITFRGFGRYIELESAYNGYIGGNYSMMNFNVSPYGISKWEIQPYGSDGAVRLYGLGMNETFGFSDMFYMTAWDDLNGSDDGTWRGASGNIIFNSLDNYNSDYQLWYFEKV